MKIAGGIIAIIGGVIAVPAGFATLAIGGVGAALEADGGNTVVMMGYVGIVCAIAAIVFGALCIGAETRSRSYALMGISIFGAILGGGMVFFFLGLSFIGGVIAMLGTNSEPVIADSEE